MTPFHNLVKFNDDGFAMWCKVAQAHLTMPRIRLVYNYIIIVLYTCTYNIYAYYTIGKYECEIQKATASSNISMIEDKRWDTYKWKI